MSEDDQQNMQTFWDALGDAIYELTKQEKYAMWQCIHKLQACLCAVLGGEITPEQKAQLTGSLNEVTTLMEGWYP